MQHMTKAEADAFETADRTRLQGPRGSSAGRVQSELRQAILDLRLVPGAAISEKALIDQYGISRTPIREALIRLRSEGLVEIFPQSGTFVARIPAAAIPEAMLIRRTLEGEVAEIAARTTTPDMMAGLRASIARQEQAALQQDQQLFHEADEAFHERLAAATGYPGLWKVTQAAKTQIDRCRRLTLPQPGRMQQVIVEHSAILDAIARQDPAAARAAMVLHLEALLPDIDRLRAAHTAYFS